MPMIKPLSGWRYDPGRTECALTVTPPYDVISGEMQDVLYARHPQNAVRLVFGRESDEDTPQNNRYTRAAAHLAAWRSEGIFLQDKPAIYPYEQTFSCAGIGYTRRGFLARVLLGEWGESGIYPHEKTLSGPKEDRLRLMRAVRGQTGPVFGLLSDNEGRVCGELDGLVDYEPFADIEDSGVKHRIWVLDDPERAQAFAALASASPIFIADGHHRYETALTYRNEVRQSMQEAGQVPPPLGELAADYILMMIVPDSDPGLVILPTHRLVHHVADFSLEGFLRGCEPNFSVRRVANEGELQAAQSSAETSVFGLVAPEALYLLTLADGQAMSRRVPDAPDAWRQLDVSVLHLLLLEDLLGIDEGRLMRKENILYSKDANDAIRKVRAGEDEVQAGFLMRPTSMRQVKAVAEAGEVMPQKSTFFYPKVLSGLVFNLFW